MFDDYAGFCEPPPSTRAQENCLTFFDLARSESTLERCRSTQSPPRSIPMKTSHILSALALGTSAIFIGQLSATASGTRGGDGGTASVGADVIVGAIPNVSKYGSVVVSGQTIMSYSIGTTSCNIGTAPLEWYASPDNRHPFIPMNAFRLKNGRFEQIGMSWGKHGFTALQQTLCGACTAHPNGTYLGVGCSDPYSSGLNGSQGGLGTRSEVNAATGTFPGSINAGMPSAAATIGRRLQVNGSDLDPALNAGAQYFFEAQYVHQQDATVGNKNNNASYRSFTVGTLTSGAYTLALTGGTIQQKAAIQAWPGLDPTATVATVDIANDGRFFVGCTAKDNGNGTWRYEYAIHNLNSDRSARGFSVPIPAGVVVTNVGFHDVNYHSGDPSLPTDWTNSLANGALTWNCGTYAASPNSNAIRFATMYNFWFDANQAPTPVNGSIELFKPGGAGAPTSAPAAVRGPSAPASDPADLNGDGAVGGADLSILLNNWGTSGAGDIDANGVVDGADLTALLNAWG